MSPWLNEVGCPFEVTHLPPALVDSECSESAGGVGRGVIYFLFSDVADSQITQVVVLTGCFSDHWGQCGDAWEMYGKGKKGFPGKASQEA